ncbi:MAG TPA: DUF222 domain-containing protein [Kofleriaceae bacterium]|nr:DUF222 domain-containing protein [Kofleriaceae bacterium]
MEKLGDRIAEHAAHLDAATHRLLADLRAFDQGGGWFQQGARSCAQWLAWRVGWDIATARQHVRVASRLGELPKIDDALRRGELSYSKVRAMTRVATPNNEEVLLHEARCSTGAQLESICRKYAAVRRHDQDITPEEDRERRYVTRRDTDDGMVRITARLHPDEAAIVWAALERGATEACRRAGRTERVHDSATTDTAHRHSEQGPDVAQPYDMAAREPTLGDRDEPRTSSSDRSDAGDDEQLSAIESTSRDEPGDEARRADDARGATDYGGLADLIDERRRAARAFDRADALVQLAEDMLRGRRRDRAPVDVWLTTTKDVLTASHAGAALGPCVHCDGGPGCEHQIVGDPAMVSCFGDGTCVSADAVQRLTCDCGVIDVVEDEHGNPISIGRKRRTIPPMMKQALLRRDETCRFPGCTARVFLQGHHLEHWARGGTTALPNLVALCSYHHRFVHEYHYSIERDADELRFLNAHGVLVPNSPPPLMPSRLGWETILDENAELAISSDTAACGWDGTPVDYDAAVHALCVVEDASQSGRVPEAN